MILIPQNVLTFGVLLSKSSTHWRHCTNELSMWDGSDDSLYNGNDEYLYNRNDKYYGVATISRLLKIIGLFCRLLSLL